MHGYLVIILELGSTLSVSIFILTDGSSQRGYAGT